MSDLPGMELQVADRAQHQGNGRGPGWLYRAVARASRSVHGMDTFRTSSWAKTQVTLNGEVIQDVDLQIRQDGQTAQRDDPANKGLQGHRIPAPDQKNEPIRFARGLGLKW